MSKNNEKKRNTPILSLTLQILRNSSTKVQKRRANIVLFFFAFKIEK